MPPAGYGWAIKLLAAITCAAYLLAGIAKLRLAGLSWIEGDQLRNQIAVDNLRKALLGGFVAPLARLVVSHPDGLVALSVLTLVIELGAPLALIGGRVARLWAGGVGLPPRRGAAEEHLVSVPAVRPRVPAGGPSRAPIAWLIGRWRSWRM